MANKFTDYLIETINNATQRAATPKESIEWLKQNVNDLLQDRKNLKESVNAKVPPGMGKSSIVKRLERNYVGRMFMYVYDPKHKDTLPYYDTLPLIILVGFTPDGFYGLNLHYVPPLARQAILEALKKNLNRANLSEKSKIKMSYKILQRALNHNVIKHCFKRYLMPHVESHFMFIDPAEWDKTIMLPTERFKKATKKTVHSNFTRG